MNFFRALGGAVAVAAFGAIVLSGVAARGAAGAGLETLLAGLTVSAAEMAGVFRWVFAAAGAGLAVAWLALLLMEERPLLDRRARASETAAAE
jgi:hypothetical protein